MIESLCVLVYASHIARLAQLVERFTYTEDAAGSSPASRTDMRKFVLCITI